MVGMEDEKEERDVWGKVCCVATRWAVFSYLTRRLQRSDQLDDMR